MHKNVGRTDAMIRMTGGLLGLAYGIGRMNRRPNNAPWLLMAFSAMKVAEGATRFCPMYAAMGINTAKGKGMPGMMDMLKKKGVQMAVSQFTRSMNFTSSTSSGNKQGEQSTAQSTPQQQQQQESTNQVQAASQNQSSQEDQTAGNTTEGLTPEDQLIEQAAREFISYRSQEKNDSSTRYPTYS